MLNEQRFVVQGLPATVLDEQRFVVGDLIARVAV